MRRVLTVVLLVAALAAMATPPAAAATVPGWEPAPSAPYDRAAGVLCDVAIHAEPIVDEVRKRVLATYPDGTPRREVYTGSLVIRVTNTATGASTDVDASGTSFIEYRPGGAFDRDSMWYSIGPALFGFREGRGNRPRGLYRIDGVYTIDFDATGFKTVTLYAGKEHDVCTDITAG
jgi:hypothetical protein